MPILWTTTACGGKFSPRVISYWNIFKYTEKILTIRNSNFEQFDIKSFYAIFFTLKKYVHWWIFLKVCLLVFHWEYSYQGVQNCTRNSVSCVNACHNKGPPFYRPHPKDLHPPPLNAEHLTKQQSSPIFTS